MVVIEDDATSQTTRPPCSRTAFTVAGASRRREYARIKIDGLRLVGGNPDFTNAPGHRDDDALFYDRQQAYVHARGGYWLPRHPSLGAACPPNPN